jgi:hypothetical protein
VIGNKARRKLAIVRAVLELAGVPQDKYFSVWHSG